MPEIIPSILLSSFSEIRNKVQEISYDAHSIQIDVVDGIYAPYKTWPFIKTPDENLEKLIREEESLPDWENVSYQFDLMVANPREIADTFVTVGASKIIVHYSSFKDDQEREVFLREFKNKYNMPEPLSVELGLAVGTDINIEEILKYKETIDFVQLMGIDHIGRQGEKFNENTIERVAELKKFLPEIVIQIDGGVKEEHIEPLIKAGANTIIVGSAIWESENPPVEFEHLKSLVG